MLLNPQMENDRRELTSEELEIAKAAKEIFDAKKKRMGLTQESAGAKLNMTQGAFNQYLNGRVPMNTDFKLRFAELMGVKVIDFDPEFKTVHVGSFSSGVESKAKIEEPVSRDDFKPIEPIGGGDEHGVYYLHGSLIKNAGVENAENIRYFQAPDDSMSPRIRKGDIVFIDTGDGNIADGVFAMWFGDKIKLRRFTLNYDKTLKLSIDSPIPPVSYETVIYDNWENLPVAGRVIWVYGNVL